MTHCPRALNLLWLSSEGEFFLSGEDLVDALAVEDRNAWLELLQLREEDLTPWRRRRRRYMKKGITGEGCLGVKSRKRTCR